VAKGEGGRGTGGEGGGAMDEGRGARDEGRGTWCLYTRKTPTRFGRRLVKLRLLPLPSSLAPLQFQNPASADPSGDSRSFSKARSLIWRIRSRVTPIRAPIFSSVIASEPCSRP